MVCGLVADEIKKRQEMRDLNGFLSNGGSLEAAQDMANHSDPRTTKLYDRRKELANLSEIERRIAFE
jgi:hypothetical protein